MKNVQVSSQRTHAHGFSLLEMLLVLFLMALMASAGLMLTEGVEDQAKYDETKRRMDLMRRAIVGDPTRTVNGSPEISGFVADMGRLPGCVRELLEPNDCANPENALTEWSIDPGSGLGSGWRGPYIQVLPERDGALRFRDGYGNSDTSDAQDSGWIWQLYQADETLTDDADAASIIRVQSFGLDGAQKYPIGDVTGEVSARPNPLIGKNDWQVQLPVTVNVTFINQSASDLPASNQNIVLRIYLSDLTDFIEGDDGTNAYLALDEKSALADGRKTHSFTLNSSPEIAIGTRAYALVCHEVPVGVPDDYVIFDGDCESANGKPNISNIRTFGVIPRQNLILNLDWIIP
ncbi:prepilin-type N-terminal cleavage/methylation domain-containing protein [Methylobacter sp. YRD-M1]|uniref:prepilin-type N-terminal cleavage/methylation domain-containing protein n=1 Tax=Methylobacter sp. YRD-M1 TaxID=2911520 RepID=UPI00227C3975|nr:prepilin-type N-terminal cleavage/methylation domain-containing protein [Methylobacter sp. YRD-M1]WAK03175.1 prepilin-type N-terminal cleavage/methylation domain-containing protein [Methylobacter sp. YRD-M1]